MIKKASTIIALGINLFSNALPALEETSSVIPKETSTMNSSKSTGTSLSQSSVPQITSNSITSTTTINEEQEQPQSQEDTQKVLTTKLFRIKVLQILLQLKKIPYPMISLLGMKSLTSLNLSALDASNLMIKYLQKMK